ncbi:hypothetical protein [Actinomadura rayongensis]
MRIFVLAGWVSDLLRARRDALLNGANDKGGLSLEWLLVVGFLVVAAGVVAVAYGGRIRELLANLGG